MSNLTDPRVLFAAERTLLAWNHTSLALSAFGFMIERSGVLVRLLRPEMDAGPELFTFLLGLGFIALGAFSALYSNLQFRKVLQSLTPEEIPAGYQPRWGMAVNGIVGLLSAMLALALLFYARP